MKYYKLTFSSNLKEVGRIPQSENCNVGDIQKDFIPWQGKINFDFKLPEPNLKKKSKQTSYINVVAIPSFFLVVDDSLLNLFKKFNIGNYQSWKIKSWQDNNLIEKYNLFILNDTQQDKYIDYSKSDFSIGKLGDWRDLSMRKAIIVKNYKEYEYLKNDLRATKEKKRLRHNNILLDLSNASEDIFRIVNVPFNGYFISERLKNVIEEKGFTGMEFKEIEEYDPKIKVIY